MTGLNLLRVGLYMCGIFGYLNKNTNTNIWDSLETGLRQLAHKDHEATGIAAE